MQIISGLTIENTTVVLDGKHFVDCTITDCVLEYSGQKVVIETTNFNACRFLFIGEAGRTVDLLRLFEMMNVENDLVPETPLGIN